MSEFDFDVITDLPPRRPPSPRPAPFPLRPTQPAPDRVIKRPTPAPR